MIISEKQIMQLMSMCRRYSNICAQMNWMDDHDECYLVALRKTTQTKTQIYTH